ncbi:unnamed protein product [Closterium sp. NIES-53]
MAAERPLLAEEEEDEAEVARAWRAVEAVRVTADVAAAARHLMALLRRVQAHGGLCDEGPTLDTAIRRHAVPAPPATRPSCCAALIPFHQTRVPSVERASPCPSASLPALIPCAPRPLHVRPSPHGSRYEWCWLQLAGRLSDDEMCRLLPPIDVEWVWLCHRLNPEAYSRECEAMVGRVVEQAVLDASECDSSHHPAANPAGCSSSSGGGREAAEAAARRVWGRLLPHEPYDLCMPCVAHGSQRGWGSGHDDDRGMREGKQCGRECGERGVAQWGREGDERASWEKGPRGDGGARCSAAGVEGQRDEGRGSGRGEHAGVPEEPLGGSGAAMASRAPGAVAVLAVAGAQGRAAVAEGVGEGRRVQYDLRGAVMRQRGLLFQVDRPWMVQAAYLRGSVQRYRMFLCLLKANPATPLTPTCDIDLIWHAHMMCARAYALDCHHLAGRLIAHADPLSPTPALAPSALACSPCALAGSSSPGARRLEAAHRATALLWERTFAVPFARAGAMPLLWEGMTPAHASSLPPPMRMGGAAVGHEQQAEAVGAGEQEGSWAHTQCRSDTASGADVERQQRRQHVEQHLRSSEEEDAKKESAGSGGTGEQGAKVRGMAVAGRVCAGEANAGLGLWQRSTVDVEVTVWTVRGLLLPAPDCLSVSLSALHAAPAFSARTAALPFHPAAPPPRWRHRFSLQAEVASEGLLLSLHTHSPSLLSSLLPWLLPPAPHELGSAVLTWHRLLQHPSLLLHCLLPLAPPGCTPAVYAAATAPLTAVSTAAAGSSGLAARAAEEGGVERVGGGRGRAEGSVRCAAGQAGLQVDVSLTPATAAPFLLRAVLVCTSDDRGAMLCAALAQHHPQAGRWVSRTVVDHRGVEAFVMRTRVAEGVREDHKRPKPLQPTERTIVLHQGGWSYMPTDATHLLLTAPLHERVGVCRGPVLAQAVPRGAGRVQWGDSVREREGAGEELVARYALMGCLPGAAMAELGVRCRVVDGALVKGSLQLELQEEGGHQVALLPGRHLSYTVCGAAASEEHGFATLVRCPGGGGAAHATALVNWRGCVVEVAREESVLLALLLCVAIAEALHDMLAAPRCMCFRSAPLPDPDPDTHWQALCLTHSSHAPSSAAARPNIGGRSEERGEEESGWAMGEQAERRWWEQRPLAWMPGAASCGAGACGPSFTHG